LFSHSNLFTGVSFNVYLCRRIFFIPLNLSQLRAFRVNINSVIEKWKLTWTYFVFLTKDVVKNITDNQQGRELSLSHVTLKETLLYSLNNYVYAQGPDLLYFSILCKKNQLLNMEMRIYVKWIKSHISKTELYKDSWIQMSILCVFKATNVKVLQPIHS
jgi:hypothetical protein